MHSGPVCLLKKSNNPFWPDIEIVVNRQIKTESIKPADARAILDKQRLNRPSSPHFTIYQPQITWLVSIAHRVTGTGLSVGEDGLEVEPAS